MKSISSIVAGTIMLLAVTGVTAFADWKTMNTGDEAGIAQGNYQLYCVNCHGEEGKGDGMLAETLDPAPRNHTDASIMSSRTDDQIYKTIAKGGSAIGLSDGMPAHETILSEAEIKGLVQYVRGLCKCKYEGK